MAEVQQEKSRGSFDSGPTCLFGTATLAWDDPTSSVEIATGLAEVHAVVLNYAEAGQAVLRERYVASVWADRMYEFLSGVCSVEPAQVA